MIGRVILAALLSGIAAGLIMGAIQHLRLTPFILEAETFEMAGHSHDHAAEPGLVEEGHGAGTVSGARENGWQRTFATTLTAAMTGAGFAAVLAAVSLLSAIPITRQNGMVWGLCGFLAVSLAPAAGLPPELPGMAAAELLPRQIWWLGTIAATGAGIFLIATRREAWAVALAVVLIGLPHVIGAPAAPPEETVLPASLAAGFVANALAANAIFWVLIGQFLGMILARTAKDIYAT